MDWNIGRNEQYEGVSMKQLSVASWESDDPLWGGDSSVSEGYGTLIASIAEWDKLDVHYNQEVISIKYSSSGVTILTKSGTVYKSRHTIVTLPLGVMKSGVVQFEPVLPPNKLRAIRYLGISTMNKIALLFPKNFWESTVIGISSPIQYEYPFFYDYSSVLNKNILLCFLTTDWAQNKEKDPDDVIVAECINHLRQVFGKNKVPDPIKTIVTKWNTDPFARGSYSHYGVGSSKYDCNAMLEPLDETSLCFAGEYMNADNIGTIHGAYMTGIQQAKRIIEYNKSILDMAFQFALPDEIVKSV